MTIVEIFRTGETAAFHGRDWPTESQAHLWWFQPIRTAVVLGSTQNAAVLDIEACMAADIEIAHRRSGGGAVLLQPGNTVWIDVVLPSHHPQWRIDIGESALWIGDVCASTLMSLGCGPMSVHAGAMQRSMWSPLVCFAGRGSGEVFDAKGSKVVGISQRRTRHWARFQCVISLQWDPETLIQVLRPPRPSVEEIAGAGSSLALEADVVGGAIIEALRMVLDTVDR